MDVQFVSGDYLVEETRELSEVSYLACVGCSYILRRVIIKKGVASPRPQLGHERAAALCIVLNCSNRACGLYQLDILLIDWLTVIEAACSLYRVANNLMGPPHFVQLDSAHRSI